MPVNYHQLYQEIVADMGDQPDVHATWIYAQLSKRGNLTRRATLQRHMRELVAWGYIEKTRDYFYRAKANGPFPTRTMEVGEYVEPVHNIVTCPYCGRRFSAYKTARQA